MSSDKKESMNIFKYLLLALLFFTSNLVFAQNFDSGARMITYNAINDNSTAEVEFSYNYNDMSGEILNIKLLGKNTPTSLTGKIFTAYPINPMGEDESLLYKKMLKGFGINKKDLNDGCYYKGKARITIHELNLWFNHHDADGNTAKIRDAIFIEKAPIYKCDNNGSLN